MRSRGPMFVLSLLLLTLFFLTASSFAIPVPSKQYATSCTLGHTDCSTLIVFDLRAGQSIQGQKGDSR